MTRDATDSPRAILPSEKVRLWVCLVAIALIGFLVCSPTLHCNFLADDFGYVQLFHSKPFHHFLQLFSMDLSEGIWGFTQDELRPLFAFSYKLDYLFFGLNSGAYHSLNVIVHVLNSILIFLIVITLAPDNKWTGLVAALLFSLAPVHAEPIAWINGAKVDSYPTCFYLASFLFYILYRHTSSIKYYGLSVITFVLGLLFKEILITLPLMLISYDLILHTREDNRVQGPMNRILRYAPFVVLTMLYLYLRRAAFGSFVREERLDPGVLAQFWFQQKLTLRRLLLPLDVITEKRAAGWQDLLVMALIGVILGILVLWTLVLIRHRSTYGKTVAYIFYFGFVWYLVSFAPLVVTYFSSRHLYLPSCGIYIATAFLLIPISSTYPRGFSLLRGATAVFLMSLFGYGLAEETSKWVKAGIISRKVRADIETLAGTIPNGSTVILSNIPAYQGDALVWRWALPFALQEPFSKGRFYSTVRVMEDPELYCCPVEEWWTKSKPVLTSLLSSRADDNRELYILRWDPQQNGMSLKRTIVRHETLKARIDHVLKKPLESIGTVEHKVAVRLIRSLARISRFSASEQVTHLDEDLIEAFGEDQAEITPSFGGFDTPTGKGVFLFEFSRGERRTAMLTIAAAAARFPVFIKRRMFLDFGLALAFDSSDGAEAQVIFKDDRGNEEVIYSEFLNPLAREEDRYWQDRRIDLSRHANKSGYLVFRCLPGPKGNSEADWLGWSDLQLLVGE